MPDLCQPSPCSKKCCPADTKFDPLSKTFGHPWSKPLKQAMQSNPIYIHFLFFKTNTEVNCNCFLLFFQIRETCIKSCFCKNRCFVFDKWTVVLGKIEQWSLTQPRQLYLELMEKFVWLSKDSLLQWFFNLLFTTPPLGNCPVFYGPLTLYKLYQ